VTPYIPDSWHSLIPPAFCGTLTQPQCTTQPVPPNTDSSNPVRMAPSFPIPSIDWLHFWEDLTHPLTIATAVGTITILHLTLARALRWRRYYSIHREYEVKWKEGRLTPGEAQRIMQTSCVYDMPWLLIRALAFALFKTYTLVSRFLSSSPR
jgi:hypothetical protein